MEEILEELEQISWLEIGDGCKMSKFAGQELHSGRQEGADNEQSMRRV